MFYLAHIQNFHYVFRDQIATPTKVILSVFMQLGPYNFIRNQIGTPPKVRSVMQLCFISHTSHMT